ncbi:hypothetical protein OAK94_01520 [bacterium]|nr:hypothetical protein [bacterium]
MRCNIAASWNARNREDYVAMFHIGRCGSTVLANMLSAHSEFHWGAEIFEKDASVGNTGGVTFARKRITNNSNQEASRIYGFETKYPSFCHIGKRCLHITIDEYLELLESLGFKNFIVLHRENYLRQAVSVRAAAESGIWFTESEKRKTTGVVIDVNDFKDGMSLVQYFEVIDEEYKYVKNLLAQRNCLHLAYEEDIQEGPGNAYKKVCSWLNISTEHPEIKLKKTRPGSLKDGICNWNDVKDELSGTKYEWMLES